MSQETELGALGFGSKLLRVNFVVGTVVLLVSIIGYQQSRINFKDTVIEQDKVELVKCKDDLAAKVEQLMNQANVNGNKGDNILERQSIILERQDRLQKSLDDLHKRKR